MVRHLRAHPHTLGRALPIYVIFTESALTESRLVIFTVTWSPSLVSGTKMLKPLMRAKPSPLPRISIMSTS